MARAKELIFSGRMIDAAEALALGLVDVVVPAEEVYPTAVALAEKYAKGPALALQAAKAAIDTGLDGSLAAGPAPGIAAVRVAVRDRGSRDRDGLVLRERAW